jgi:hypothetical protein
MYYYEYWNPPGCPRSTCGKLLQRFWSEPAFPLHPFSIQTQRNDFLVDSDEIFKNLIRGYQICEDEPLHASQLSVGLRVVIFKCDRFSPSRDSWRNESRDSRVFIITLI